MAVDLIAMQTALESSRSEIVELADVENPTEEQSSRLAALTVQFPIDEAAYNEANEAETKRLATIEHVRSVALADPANTERTFHAPNVNSNRSPWDGIEHVRGGFVPASDLRARALTAIEQTDGVSDAYQERATQLVQQGRGIPMHVLLTGQPAYRSAFGKYLRNPEMFAADLDPEEAAAFRAVRDYEQARAALSTSAANGGYLIPWLQDNTIVLTNDGTANPIRQISKVVVGTSNAYNAITSAGVTAEWKGEGSAAADASPTFARPGITAVTGFAYVLGSYESFADTDVEAELPGLVQDAKDRLEATAFTTGAGPTAAPHGVVTAVSAVTTSRVTPTTGGAFSAASELYLVVNALPPRHRRKASWIAAETTINKIRTFDTTGAGRIIADLSMGEPPLLLGKPLYEASDMVTAVTTGSNILLAGNFSECYYIYDRAGTTLEYIPNVMDVSTGRPTGQRGFAAWWRTGADAVDPNGFRVLKL